MTLDTTHRNRLLALARQSIDLGLQETGWAAMSTEPLPNALTALRGSFVTLRIDKQLRGCCGTLIAKRAVGEDVWRNAWASAFADPRFAPLEADEWGDVHVHISVLSELEPICIANEDELLEQLRPNVDGLVLERGEARATFLPDVWEQIPNAVDFVGHLKQKAGWPANSWSPQINVWRYTTESFGEREVPNWRTSAA